MKKLTSPIISELIGRSVTWAASFVVLCGVVATPAFANNPCTSGNLYPLIGATCDIGYLQFTFTKFQGNRDTVYDSTTKVSTPGTPWGAQQFYFTVLPGLNGFSLSYINASQIISPETLTGPGEGSSFSASDYAQLFYTVVDLRGGITGESVSAQFTAPAGKAISQGSVVGTTGNGVTDQVYSQQYLTQVGGLTVTGGPAGSCSGSPCSGVSGAPLSSGSGVADIFSLGAINNDSVTWDGTSTFTFTTEALVYVTNFLSPNTVSVIGTASNTVVATITVGNDPEGVAVTPDGAHVYVANNYDDTVSVIDTRSNTVVATIPVGAQPTNIAITSDGAHVYVIAAHALSMIDTASNTVVATIPVGQFPQRVATTPDGAHAYITDSADSAVLVIATGSSTVVATIPVGQFPQGVVITPDGAHAYITDSADAAVFVIATASNTVVSTIYPVGGYPDGVAITPDGTHAYIANGYDGTVSVIATASNTVVATVPVGVDPVAVAVTPDGAYVYVANFHDDTVSVIATGSNTVVATIPVGLAPSGVAITTPAATAPTILSATQVSTTASGLAYRRVSQTFNGTVTIQNVSGTTLSGPFEIVFTGLPGGVSLVNPTGNYNSSPYLSAPSTSGLAPGQSATVSVQFKNPLDVKINFTPVIYSGSLN